MRLDHVNLRTRQLARLVDFYARTLGLRSGPRPPFPFPGAWLYAGEQAVIHLIGLEGAPGDGRQQPDLSLEHFALASSGLAALLERLEAEGVPARVARVPGGGPIQVNLFDPDGNHLHIDFAPEEGEGLAI